MEATKIDGEKGKKLRFMTFIIPVFAHYFKMNEQEAYRYLKKYGGLDYLNECWWALHTDSAEYAARDMFVYCRNNGGLR
ncbi:hypothetical protein AGMMS49965_26390 [Bacteroidia bacterium]|nr:hypothetical protein AGMMS49965_26390 [Bacteroidia bacterium]